MALGESLVAVDLDRKIAKRTAAQIRFSAWFRARPSTASRSSAGSSTTQHLGIEQGLIFNFGFDAKGARDVHWAYYPAKATTFYRVGWYDNIFDTDRMSLYVRSGFPKDATIDARRAASAFWPTSYAKGWSRPSASSPNTGSCSTRRTCMSPNVTRRAKANLRSAVGTRASGRSGDRALDLLRDRGQYRRGAGARDNPRLTKTLRRADGPPRAGAVRRAARKRPSPYSNRRVSRG